MRLVLEAEPARPQLIPRKGGRELSTICLKCSEKKPDQRYASALDLAEDLERWLRDEPIRAQPAGLLKRGKKYLRRNPGLATATISLALAAAIAALFIWKDNFPRLDRSRALPCFHSKT